MQLCGTDWFRHSSTFLLGGANSPHLCAVKFDSEFAFYAGCFAHVGLSHNVKERRKMLRTASWSNIISHRRDLFIATRNVAPNVLAARFESSLPTIRQHIIVALGGNALLRRGEAMTMENQRANVKAGAMSLKSILENHSVTIVHGNGPQSGLLLLESANYEKQTGLTQMGLDVIDAETEGMIGYILEQELSRFIPKERGMATILSQVLVDPNDPAFANPTKFVGPIYTKEEANKLGLPVKADGDHYRRVVPSPRPLKLLDHEMRALQILTDAGCCVIAAGGGGIPVVIEKENTEVRGVEAVIDKDRAATMLGKALNADGLLILTDVVGVATDYKTDSQKWIRAASPGTLHALIDEFPDGSMGPKCESAIEFASQPGKWAAIGSLQEADKVLAGMAGTRIFNQQDGQDFIEFYDDNGVATTPEK
jgi:carbamate kinase